MRYFKLVNDGYILCIGQGNAGTEISKTMYNKIMKIIQAKPPATSEVDYRLRDKDLTWEEYKPEPEPEPEEKYSPDEILKALFGTDEMSKDEISKLKKQIDEKISEKDWKGG